MSLCPICGKLYCDHTSEERGQTIEEMSAPLTKNEEKAFDKHLDSEGYISEKVAAGRSVRDAQYKKRNRKKKS